MRDLVAGTQASADPARATPNPQSPIPKDFLGSW